VFGLSTASAAPVAPVTFQAMVTSVPGEENGASGVPCTGQVGCFTTDNVTVACGLCGALGGTVTVCFAGLGDPELVPVAGGCALAEASAEGVVVVVTPGEVGAGGACVHAERPSTARLHKSPIRILITCFVRADLA
jgi:hypothetical protein